MRCPAKLRLLRHRLLLGLSTGLLATTLTVGVAAATGSTTIEFDMVRNAALPSACVPNAKGHVVIRTLGPVEVMEVAVTGLPPTTNFDFFVIQVPKAPFGISWYQGDMETNAAGRDHQRFVGRFSIETFSVAPGTASAPEVFDEQPFPDTEANPPFRPIQMYHLGLWFNSPEDAQKAGCPNTVTPFNGEHHAGVQVLNTSNFNDDQGPLRQLQP